MDIVKRYLPVTFFVVFFVFLYLWHEEIRELVYLISGNNVTSYIIYVALLTMAVVLMPVTVMPLIPLAATVMGPFATALLSILGWTLGAVIAFLLSRTVGRKILSKFISLEKIDSMGAKFPKDTKILMVFLLRMTLPVDVVSYALGLSTSIKLSEYIIGTVLGVTWFSFAFAYGGDALLSGNLPLIIELSGISVFLLLVSWYWLSKRR